MSLFSKENLLALTAFGLGIGGYLFFKNNQNVNSAQAVEEEEGDEIIEKETMIKILKSVQQKMKYYHRLAQSIHRQQEGKSEYEQEEQKKQFFETFKKNDYKVIVKNIAEFEFGVSYEIFENSLEYYASSKEEDIIKIDDEIERNFLQNLMGNKTLLAPHNSLLQNIDKQTAKEIFKEIYRFKFYQILSCVQQYLKKHQKIKQDEEFFNSFKNIYNEIDKKLSSFLLLDQVSENERNFNCFFELLVYYCEGDLQYSGFIREMEIQAILLCEKIIAQSTNFDIKEIKNQFSNI